MMTARSLDIASALGGTGPLREDLGVRTDLCPEHGEYQATGTRLLGINNRDLRTFVTSLEHTFTLQRQIPADVLLVSESGIATAADMQRLRSAGVGAVLVGESLMRQPDIAVAVHNLLSKSDQTATDSSM